MDEEERIEHPTFGQIGITRTSGGEQRFYGSEMTSDHYLSLTIRRSEMIRDLSHTRYHGKEELIRIRMNAVQFSEMITSMNIDDGVPCTIEYIGRESQGR